MELKTGYHLRELVGIEYPGFVKNVDKMMETLGGIEELSKEFTENQRVQLKFHPKNVYCKPTFGDRIDCTGLLLKIKIRKSKKHPEQKPEILSTDIVGQVTSMYKFTSMCDYQYLPIQKNQTTGETECFYDDIVPQGILEPKWLRENLDVPLFLPPLIFSRTDTPQISVLKKGNRDEDPTEKTSFAATNRASRCTNGTPITFSMTEPIPMKPKENMSNVLKVNLIQQEHYDIIHQLFKKRPIWTNAAVKAECTTRVRRVSFILASVAYHYSTGPWRNCFVRHGYDPRKNFESRFYQLLDYRVRQSGGFKSQMRAKRGTGTIRKYRGKKQGTTERDDFEEQQTNVNEAIFTLDTIPPFRAKHYQFCDIHVPKIQEMLHKIPTPMSGAICNEKRGWLPAGFLEQCRNILTQIAQANIIKQCKEQGISPDDLNAEDNSDDEDFEEDDDASGGDDDFVSGDEEEMEVDQNEMETP